MARFRLLRAAEPDDPKAAAANDLRLAGRGDEQAFARFYDVVAPTVFGTVLRVVRSRALAEEVTQEVFLELWRQAPRYDADRGAPTTWAATIAHRRAVDRVRSEESSRVRDDRHARTAPVEHDTVAETVTDEAVAEYDRARVARALDRLTDAQREAVTLAYYGGHTYREVAVLLDTPEGTVKTRIRDGLIKLRDFLEVTT
ncbi:MAG: sigma-70 family RNA polymerase sigma factor [Ilumatobacteraceae bacterium]